MGRFRSKQELGSTVSLQVTSVWVSIGWLLQHRLEKTSDWLRVDHMVVTSVCVFPLVDGQ